jgi:hypothetical protein
MLSHEELGLEQLCYKPKLAMRISVNNYMIMWGAILGAHYSVAFVRPSLFLFKADSGQAENAKLNKKAA